MRNSKLIDLFQSLSKAELRFFGKYFVQNSSWNTNAYVKTLFKILLKYHPNFEEKQVNKEKLFKKVFSTLNKYNNKKMIDTMSALTVLIDKYLIHEVLQKERVTRDFLLLQAYQERHLDKYFFQQSTQLQKHLAKQTLRDMDYHYQSHYLNRLIYAHPQTSKLKTNENSFKDALEHLNAFYFSSLLKWKCIAINRADILAENTAFTSLNLIPPLVPQLPYQHIPAIEIYYQLSELLNAEKIDDFEPIKAKILNNLAVFNLNEQRNILIWLINCCVKQFHKGHTNFLAESLTVCQFGLERDIWLENNIFPEDKYKIMLAIAFGLNQLDWIEHFIGKYSQFLREEIKESTITFQSARLAFERQQYQKVIELLAHFEQQDFYDSINTKTLLIRSYYELQEHYFDELEHLIDSFTKYLQRKAQKRPIAEEIKVPALNFIKLVKKLFDADFNTKTKQTLQQQIKSTPQLICKKWLLKKVQLL